MKYDIIYADPAWPYTGAKDKDAAAGKHYDLMSWEDLSSMPVRDIGSKDSLLLMWATSPLMHLQIPVMQRWGYHYRGVGFVWVKTRRDGGIISGQGVPPTFTKPTTEYLLVGTSCKTGRPFSIFDKSMGQVVLHERLAHSEKPQVFRDKILKVCGNRSRIELFARKRVDGWHSSGIELDGIDYKTGELRGIHK